MEENNQCGLKGEEDFKWGRTSLPWVGSALGIGIPMDEGNEGGQHSQRHGHEQEQNVG